MSRKGWETDAKNKSRTKQTQGGGESARVSGSLSTETLDEAGQTPGRI